jgi:hypothetical protein
VGGSPRVESTETDNIKMYVQRHRWNGLGGLNSNFPCMSCLKFFKAEWVGLDKNVNLMFCVAT